MLTLAAPSSRGGLRCSLAAVSLSGAFPHVPEGAAAAARARETDGSAAGGGALLPAIAVELPLDEFARRLRAVHAAALDWPRGGGGGEQGGGDAAAAAAASLRLLGSWKLHLCCLVLARAGDDAALTSLTAGAAAAAAAAATAAAAGESMDCVDGSAASASAAAFLAEHLCAGFVRAAAPLRAALAQCLRGGACPPLLGDPVAATRRLLGETVTGVPDADILDAVIEALGLLSPAGSLEWADAALLRALAAQQSCAASVPGLSLSALKLAGARDVRDAAPIRLVPSHAIGDLRRQMTAGAPRLRVREEEAAAS
jgi:hypothetical protein